MSWFRKHVKSGSRLALLALAIQFALSFGHFHADLARAAPTVLLAGLTDAAAQPTSNQDGDRHVTDCAICAVLSLANNFLSATPPLLQLPQAAARLQLTTRAEFGPLGPLHTAFRSRAPPLS